MNGPLHSVPGAPDTPALQVETLLRSVTSDPCTSAADMVRLQTRPLEALVSVEAAPEEAAAAFFAQRRGGGLPDEGWVRLQWYGEDLTEPELWESVGFHWSELVGALAVALNASEDAFGQCIPLIEEDGLSRVRLEVTGGGVVATGLGPRRLFGAPADVLSPLLAGARRWLTFCRDELGLRPTPPLSVLDELDGLLARHLQRTGHVGPARRPSSSASPSA